MWINQKTDQLVANPDIRSFLTTDLYVAPVEFTPGEEAPASGRLMLAKDQPAAFQDWTLLFRRFDMARQNAVPGALTVGMVVELQRPGVERSCSSLADLDERRHRSGRPVDIRGARRKLRATGMSVDQDDPGRAARPRRRAPAPRPPQGEVLTYEALKIRFDDFDLSEFNPDAGQINFGVVFEVERDGQTVEVVPRFKGGMAGGPELTPATVPGAGGVTLAIGRVDAEGGAVELQIIDPTMASTESQPASLVLDISTKPLIALVWLGTLMVMAGVGMAIALRRSDIARSRELISEKGSRI
jgi:hypothetical protein